LLPFIIRDCRTVTRELIVNCFVLINHCSATCIKPENIMTKRIKYKYEPISVKLKILIICLLNRISIIRDIIEILVVISIDKRIIPFASCSLLGNTMAIGYVSAAIGATILTIAIKVPIKPYASGPYNRVIIGDKALAIIWAAAVPLANIMTFRTNGFLLNFINLFFIKISFINLYE